MRSGWVFRLAATLALAPGLALAADAGDSSAYHIYPTPQARGALPKPALRSTGTPRMLYYGGPVLSHVKIVSVIWGSGVNATTVSKIGGFLGAVADSTFLDQLAEYGTNLTGTNGHAGTNQKIGRGRYIGQFTIVPRNTSRKLTDGAIQAELRAQIAAGKLPKADLNTLYMTYFPANVSITSFGKSCVAFGAYHSASSSTVTPGNLFYGVMPDCGRGFADLTMTSSHEIAEAVSDAIPTPGSHPAYPQAWNTSDGYEIADLCEGTRAALKTAGQSYAVQRVYLNSVRKCGGGTFTSP